MTAPTVNAYYSPSHNQMVFPAGILQPPFFSKAWPEAYNYGAIGVVMGHELTHGFDDMGSQFDASGNYNPWWPEATQFAFDQRTQCMARQFSRYSVTTESGDELFLNGNLTLGENIADSGGLKSAHAALLTRIGQAKADAIALPGLDLTSEQLFFVAYSQVWCSLYRDGAIEAQLRTDPHSPGKFRIIGGLVNSQDFAKSFSCPEGSPMNPAEKCSVW
jgi:endothelin-converting enzyme